MADGWDDDDDLGLDSTSNGDVGGWGDDDDALMGLSDDDDSASSPIVPTTAPAVRTTPLPVIPLSNNATTNVSAENDPKEEENGWGDDDEDFFDDADDDKSELNRLAVNEPNAPVPPDQPLVPSITPSLQFPESQPPESLAEPVIQDGEEDSNEAEGWGDDDDFLVDDSTSSHRNNDVSTKHEHVTFQQPHPILTSTPPTTAGNSIQPELEHYIQTLPAHTASVQAVLDAEYNTVEKALELESYYASRPQLLPYTVEKELPRMEYTLMHEGEPITDKAMIAQLLTSEPQYTESLAARCANQSLLADILQVMTGHDRVVRPQYHAVAIATACHFQILSPDTTQAVASLELSLPSPPPTGRWTIAVLRVAVVLDCSVPQCPSVQFRLVDIVPTSTSTTTATHSKPAFQQKLHDCATLLDTMAQEDARMESMMMEHQQQQPQSQNFRDVFLQTQSRYLTESATDAMVGIQSALKDLDAATGLGSKLRTILPDVDLVAQVEAEEKQQQAAIIAQQQAQSQQTTSHRPTSILGGFVRSLAQSVALPEEDPSLYETSGPPAAAAAPSLYRRQEAEPSSTTTAEAAAIPSLYRREEPPAAQTPTPVTTAPSLYRREEQPSSGPNQQQQQQQPAPSLYRRAEEDASTTQQVSFPKLYQQQQPVPSLPNQDNSPAAFPRLYNAESSSKEPKAVELTLDVSNETRGVNQDEPSSADGWGDEDDIDLDLSDGGVDASAPSPAPFVYDPETDIIPNRKRWIHPTPNAQRTFLAA